MLVDLLDDDELDVVVVGLRLEVLEELDELLFLDELVVPDTRVDVLAFNLLV